MWFVVLLALIVLVWVVTRLTKKKRATEEEERLRSFKNRIVGKWVATVDDTAVFLLLREDGKFASDIIRFMHYDHDQTSAVMNFCGQGAAITKHLHEPSEYIVGTYSIQISYARMIQSLTKKKSGKSPNTRLSRFFTFCPNG
ncbi:MAG: hypothetical protein FWB98_05190 [Defluviitaleaceae bacterium]|nr:hypothetical protein [Defluviitaleaceae bacterium]